LRYGPSPRNKTISSTIARSRSSSRRARPRHSSAAKVPDVQVAPQHQVVEHAEGVEEGDVLEHPRDAGARDLGGRLARELVPEELDRPVLRAVDARQAVEHRRLAGAVRSDDREQLLLLDVERDALQRPDAAEAQVHVPDLEHRASRSRLRPAAGKDLGEGLQAAHRLRLP
jgi:hypothetical protein